MKKICAVIVLLTSASLSGCVFSQEVGESICLLPKGFEGPVFIIFGQKDGLNPTVENGRHVYVIPSSGILKTKAEVNFRIKENEFYYLMPNGERIKIEYLYPGGNAWQDKAFTEDKVDLNKDEIYVFSDVMGSTTDKQGKEVRFRQFLVGKLKDKLKLHSESERKVSIAMDSIVHLEP